LIGLDQNVCHLLVRANFLWQRILSIGVTTHKNRDPILSWSYFSLNVLAFAPRLPEDIARLTFRVLFRNRHIGVEVTATDAKYHLLEGSALAVWHHGDKLALSTNEAVTLPIPRIKAGPRPTQPPGRVPLERAAQSLSN
jgi:Glycosyl hydrolase family 65, C-terminal domain